MTCRVGGINSAEHFVRSTSMNSPALRGSVAIIGVVLVLGNGRLSLSGQGKQLATVSQSLSVYVLDVSGNGWQLTGASDGVLFDIEGDGSLTRTAWTSAESDDVFLVL